MRHQYHIAHTSGPNGQTRARTELGASLPQKVNTNERPRVIFDEYHAFSLSILATYAEIAADWPSDWKRCRILTEGEIRKLNRNLLGTTEESTSNSFRALLPTEQYQITTLIKGCEAYEKDSSAIWCLQCIGLLPSQDRPNVLEIHVILRRCVRRRSPSPNIDDSIYHSRAQGHVKSAETRTQPLQNRQNAADRTSSNDLERELPLLRRGRCRPATVGDERNSSDDGMAEDYSTARNREEMSTKGQDSQPRHVRHHRGPTSEQCDHRGRPSLRHISATHVNRRNSSSLATSRRPLRRADSSPLRGTKHVRWGQPRYHDNEEVLLPSIPSSSPSPSPLTSRRDPSRGASLRASENEPRSSPRRIVTADDDEGFRPGFSSGPSRPRVHQRHSAPASSFPPASYEARRPMVDGPEGGYPEWSSPTRRRGGRGRPMMYHFEEGRPRRRRGEGEGELDDEDTMYMYEASGDRMYHDKH